MSEMMSHAAGGELVFDPVTVACSSSVELVLAAYRNADQAEPRMTSILSAFTDRSLVLWQWDSWPGKVQDLSCSSTLERILQDWMTRAVSNAPSEDDDGGCVGTR